MPNICLTFGTHVAASNIQLALTTLEGLASWWTTDTKGNPAEGGELVFTFGNNGGFVMRVHKSTAEQVQWQCIQGPDEWLGTLIEFDLVQQPNHCQLMFRHRGWAAEVPFFLSLFHQMGDLLLSLRDYLEQGCGRPFPDDLKIEASGM